MADEALYYMELVELTRRMHAKEISPVDATKAELDRIGKLDKSLHSFALVMPEAALEQARHAEVGDRSRRHQGPAPWRADRRQGSVLDQRACRPQRE